MSQGHGDPPADVRAFLPRPGEPVEQYAERLRALHRDLTLVLEAVERGLATAGRPAEGHASEPDAAEEPPRWRRTGPPAEVDAAEVHGAELDAAEVHADEPADPWEEGPVEIHPVAPSPPPAAAERPAPAPAGPRPAAVPRIEVVPARSGRRRREEDEHDELEERRRPAEPRPSTSDAPTPRATRPFPARPSAAGVPAEPAWVEGEGEGFTPAQLPDPPAGADGADGAGAPGGARVPARATDEARPAPQPARGGSSSRSGVGALLHSASPVVVGAMVAGWLLVVVLVLALVVS